MIYGNQRKNMIMNLLLFHLHQLMQVMSLCAQEQKYEMSKVRLMIPKEMDPVGFN